MSRSDGSAGQADDKRLQGEQQEWAGRPIFCFGLRGGDCSTAALIGGRQKRLFGTGVPRVDRKALIEWLEPEVADLGYELLDLEWSQGRGATLRLFIDAPDGVTLDDCERVSRAVEALLDVEDTMPGPYRLEVSSPGPERPLRTAAHFSAVQGETVRLRFADGAAVRKIRGRVVGVDEKTLRLQHADEEVRVELNDIVAARLVPAEKAFPRKGKR